MASGTLGSSLKHLRDLFGGGTAIGLGDGELLRRYAASHDGPAFEAWWRGTGRWSRRPAAPSCAITTMSKTPSRPPSWSWPARRLDPRGRCPRRLAASRGLSRRGPAEHRTETESASTSRRSRRWRSRDDPCPCLISTCARSCTRRSTGCPKPSPAGRPLRPRGPDLRAGRQSPALDRADPLLIGSPRPGKRLRDRLIRRGVTATAVGVGDGMFAGDRRRRRSRRHGRRPRSRRRLADRSRPRWRHWPTPSSGACS